MITGMSVTQQLRGLCQALLLGGGLGLLYDGMRVFRRCLPLRWIGCAVDLLFWLLAAVGLFAFSHQAWAGQIRLYGAAFCLLGGSVYFWGISPAVMPVFGWIAGCVKGILGILTAPVRLFLKLFKRIGKFLKTSFLSEKKGV